MADNNTKRLLGVAERIASAALALANHLNAFLACGDAVAVTFEDFFGNPSHDGFGRLIAEKPLCKLRFKLLNV